MPLSRLRTTTTRSRPTFASWRTSSRSDEHDPTHTASHTHTHSDAHILLTLLAIYLVRMLGAGCTSRPLRAVGTKPSCWLSPSVAATRASGASKSSAALHRSFPRPQTPRATTLAQQQYPRRWPSPWTARPSCSETPARPRRKRPSKPSQDQSTSCPCYTGPRKSSERKRYRKRKRDCLFVALSRRLFCQAFPRYGGVRCRR